MNPFLSALLAAAIALGIVPLSLAAEPKPSRSITLDEALHLAVENDERIAVTEKEIRVAGLEKSRALTIVTPRADALGQYQRPKTDIPPSVPEQTWRATFRVTQPLLDARVFPARKLGAELEGAAKENFAFTVRAALLQVVADYYNALRAREQIKVSEKTLELASKEVARAQARFKAGEARNTEVLRAEVDEALAQRNLAFARNDYQLILSQLGRRLGISASEPFEVVDPKEEGKALGEDLKKLFDLALFRRNDLAFAKRQVRIATERRNVTSNERLPTLDLEYNHRFLDPDSNTNRNNFWELFVVANFDIWEGGQRTVTLKQQQLQIEQAQLRVRELEKLIETEIQQALLDLKLIEVTLKSVQKEVTLAQTNFDTLSEQARVGLATSLDVSTALTALDRARTELTRLLFQREVARRNLEAAVGVFADEIVVKLKE